MATIPKPTLTSPPTPPTLADPANFDPRADAFVGWLADAWSDFGDVVDFVEQESTTAATKASEASASATNAAASAATSSTKATDAAASAASALGAPGTSATSTTSLTIGTGSKSLTIQTGKAFAVGQFVVVANTGSPATYWMHGQISAYNIATGALTVQVGLASGSATLVNWTIALSGPVPQAIAWASVTGKPAFFGDATATWASPARVVNTWYQNTTGRALAVHIAADSGTLSLSPAVGGAGSVYPWTNFDGAGGRMSIVPNGWSYRLVSVGFDSWREM